MTVRNTTIDPSRVAELLRDASSETACGGVVIRADELEIFCHRWLSGGPPGTGEAGVPDLVSRCAALSNDLYDLVRECGESSLRGQGYYGLAHDLLQQARHLVSEAHTAACAAEAIHVTRVENQNLKEEIARLLAEKDSAP